MEQNIFSLCNRSICDWCVEKPSKCLKCAYPLVLEQSTYTCKPCCVKGHYGKFNNLDCCECSRDSESIGQCGTFSNDFITSFLHLPMFNMAQKTDDNQKPPTSISAYIVSFVLFLTTVLFLICGMRLVNLKCNHLEGSTEYSPLMQSFSSHNDRVEKSDDEYELSNQQIKHLLTKNK